MLLFVLIQFFNVTELKQKKILLTLNAQLDETFKNFHRVETGTNTVSQSDNGFAHPACGVFFLAAKL